MVINPQNTVIGFIGIGVMGKSMAKNLMDAGYPLHIFTRTKEKAADLLKNGAIWQECPSSLTKKCNVIITMVGYPHDVEEIYLGESGIIKHAKQSSILIDMTTSSPILAQKIAEKAKEKSLHTLDAPVSGGDVGAREGKLSIMVGGEEGIYEKVLPIFKVMGEIIIYQGPSGAGQHTKMCNQMTLANNMVGVCEALIYAEKAGLNPSKVLESIQSGAAGSWALSKLAPRIINEDFEPGFYVKHFIKDMTIAQESIKDMKLDAKGLSLSLSLYKELADKGGENEGTQALYKLYS